MLRDIRELNSTPLAILANMCNVSTDCYRSRIPFLTDRQLQGPLELLMMALSPNLLEDCNNASHARRHTHVYGRCTARSETYTPDQLVREVGLYCTDIYISRFTLVNLTNRNHWEVIETMSAPTDGYTDYLGYTWKLLEKTQMVLDEKPVDIAILSRDSADTPHPTYYAFTTYWRHELLQVLYNKMLNYCAAYETAKGNIKQPRFLELLTSHLETGAPIDYDKVFAILKADYLDKLQDIYAERMAQRIESLATMKVNNERQVNAAMENLRNSIAQWQRQIRDAYEELGNLTKRMLNPEGSSNLFKEAQTVLTGLMKRGALTGLKLVTGSNGYLRHLKWKVRIPITYWEDDEVQQWVNYYRNYGNKYTVDFIQAALIDKSIKIWCEQWIALDIPNMSCSNSREDGTDANFFPTIYPPHPHIGYYNCFGNNHQTVTEALSKQDIATAMSACMNACMQINLTDGTVTRNFIDNMTGNGNYSSMACLEYKGKMYSPDQLKELHRREGGFNNGTEN